MAREHQGCGLPEAKGQIGTVERQDAYCMIFVC